MADPTCPTCGQPVPDRGHEPRWWVRVSGALIVDEDDQPIAWRDQARAQSVADVWLRKGCSASIERAR